MLEGPTVLLKACRDWLKGSGEGLGCGGTDKAVLCAGGVLKKQGRSHRCHEEGSQKIRTKLRFQKWTSSNLSNYCETLRI